MTASASMSAALFPVFLLAAIGGGNENVARCSRGAHASCYPAAEMLDFTRQGPHR